MFSHLGAGAVKRYELPNLYAFICDSDALDGGVNASRSLDGHGKTLSFILLSRLILDIPEALIPQVLRTVTLNLTGDNVFRLGQVNIPQRNRYYAVALRLQTYQLALLRRLCGHALQ